MFVNCVIHLLVLPRHAQPAVQLFAGQTIQLLYFCTKNKVVVGVRDLRGGGGRGKKEHELRVLKGWEVQVLNNLQWKKG